MLEPGSRRLELEPGPLALGAQAGDVGAGDREERVALLHRLAELDEDLRHAAGDRRSHPRGAGLSTFTRAGIGSLQRVAAAVTAPKRRAFQGGVPAGMVTRPSPASVSSAAIGGDVAGGGSPVSPDAAQMETATIAAASPTAARAPASSALSRGPPASVAWIRLHWPALTAGNSKSEGEASSGAPARTSEGAQQRPYERLLISASGSVPSEIKIASRARATLLLPRACPAAC